MEDFVVVVVVFQVTEKVSCDGRRWCGTKSGKKEMSVMVIMGLLELGLYFVGLNWCWNLWYVGFGKMDQKSVPGPLRSCLLHEDCVTTWTVTQVTELVGPIAEATAASEGPSTEERQDELYESGLIKSESHCCCLAEKVAVMIWLCVRRMGNWFPQTEHGAKYKFCRLQRQDIDKRFV